MSKQSRIIKFNNFKSFPVFPLEDNFLLIRIEDRIGLLSKIFKILGNHSIEYYCFINVE